jgi:hypothetical protein
MHSSIKQWPVVEYHETQPKHNCIQTEWAGSEWLIAAVTAVFESVWEQHSRFCCFDVSLFPGEEGAQDSRRATTAARRWGAQVPEQHAVRSLWPNPISTPYAFPLRLPLTPSPYPFPLRLQNKGEGEGEGVEMGLGRFLSLRYLPPNMGTKPQTLLEVS